MTQALTACALSVTLLACGGGGGGGRDADADAGAGGPDGGAAVAGVYRGELAIAAAATPSMAALADHLEVWTSAPGDAMLRHLAMVSWDPESGVLYWEDAPFDVVFEACTGVDAPAADCAGADDFTLTDQGLLLAAVAEDELDANLGSSIADAMADAAPFDPRAPVATSELELGEPGAGGAIDDAALAVSSLAWELDGDLRELETGAVDASVTDAAWSDDGLSLELALEADLARLTFEGFGAALSPFTLPAVDSVDAYYAELVDCESFRDRAEAVSDMALADTLEIICDTLQAGGLVAPAAVALPSATVAITLSTASACETTAEGGEVTAIASVGNPCAFDGEQRDPANAADGDSVTAELSAERAP